MNCRLVEPFNGIVAAPNALMITGGPTTVILVALILPFPPSVEVTITLLVFTPGVVPRTFTETVQEAFAAIVPPNKLTALMPGTAVTEPPQLLVTALGVATTNPAGRLSVNAIPFSARPLFGL